MIVSRSIHQIAKTTKTLLVIGIVLHCQSLSAALMVDGNLVTNIAPASQTTYDSSQPDPTVLSELQQGQLILNSGGSLTQTSGSLTVTSFGNIIIGQTTGSGTVTLSGGEMILNANIDTPNIIFGNNGATGIGNVSAGVLTLNASTFYIGRENGSGIFNLSGAGIISSSASNFIMGAINGQGTVNLSGVGVFSLTNFSEVNFVINTGSMFSFTSGSLAQLSFGSSSGAASEVFFTSLIDNGYIRIDGTIATADQFNYSVVGNQGVLALVPEPSTVGLIMVAGASLLFTIVRAQGRRVA